MKNLDRTPIATICIPATRLDRTLINCLESLEKQTDKRFCVIIVTKTQEKLITRRLKTCSFLMSIQQQLGMGLIDAVNTALAQTQTSFFIRIDDDVVVEPEWFAHLTKPFIKPDVGGVTGPTIIPKKQLENRDVMQFIVRLQNADSLLLLPFKQFFFQWLYDGKLWDVATFVKSGSFTFGSNFEEMIPLAETEVENLEACNFAVRTKLLKKLGGFDTAYAQGLGEYHEADMACKLRQKKYKLIYSPRAAVKHIVQNIDPNARVDAYGRMLNFIRFYKRYFIISDLITLLKFCSNIWLQNWYHVYSFLRTGDRHYLGSIPATVKGLCFDLEKK